MYEGFKTITTMLWSRLQNSTQINQVTKSSPDFGQTFLLSCRFEHENTTSCKLHKSQDAHVLKLKTDGCKIHTKLSWQWTVILF